MKFGAAVFLTLYAFCEFQSASEAISIRVPTNAPGTSSSGTDRRLIFGAPGSSPGARGPPSTNSNRLARGPPGAPGSPSSRGQPNPQQCPGSAQDMERRRKAQERADQILREALSSDESCVSINPPPPGSQRYLFPGSMTLL